MLKTSGSFYETFKLLENVLNFLHFSIILCYDMLRGLYETSRSLVRRVTTSAYPWIVTVSDTFDICSILAGLYRDARRQI